MGNIGSGVSWSFCFLVRVHGGGATGGGRGGISPGGFQCSLVVVGAHTLDFTPILPKAVVIGYRRGSCIRALDDIFEFTGVTDHD